MIAIIRTALAATLVCTAAWAVAEVQPASPRRFVTIEDMARILTVADPRLSPDGAWVAYSVTSTDVEKDERGTDVWMSSWDGAQHLRLTSSPESETSPRWSPDGRYLAFLATRGDEAEKKRGDQVWLLDRRGGEAVKLTDLPGGVSDFAWSPDGARLALVSRDPDPDDEPEKKPGWMRKTAPPIVITRYLFKTDEDGYLKPLYNHIHVFDLASRKAEAITSGPFDDTAPAWSPDGRRIAFLSERACADPDREHNSDVFVVEARPGAAPLRLTAFAGPDTGPPVWSPDGAWIAYLQGDESRFSAYDQEKLAIVPSGGGEPRVLTAALDRAVSSPRWTRDGAALVFLVADDRAQWVGRVPVKGGEVERVTSGRRVVAGLSDEGPRGFAVIAGTAATPNEVHAVEAGGLRPLTRHNAAWLAGLELARTEDVSFRAPDGTVVNGLLSTPPAHVPGRTYPALLNIHGGPDGQDEHSFDFEREFLAANGYVVLQVNYRGSDGRGSAFQKAIFADWGHLEVVDLLAGADYLATLPIVDRARLGIGGWSYGGILTDYTIATDARFKAAVSGAGSALQTSMYGVDQYVEQYDQELGAPWRNRESWLRVSYPFFHADRIRTPTLFLCGEADFNVPLVGSEQMYQALRAVGVDTQLIIYPGAHHVPSRPSYRRDHLTRSVAWFDRYLKTPVPAPK
ncbi:MAG: prolyl oligopeptidase family serine peptidase [Acidobacteriota bacterium]